MTFDGLHPRQAERKREAFDKLGNKCAKCGSTENLYIDHVDPSKRNSKTRHKVYNTGVSIWKLSDKDFYAELPKCQLLCHNCHMSKTLKEQGLERQGDKHNRSRYGNFGCRCEICKKAQSDYRRKLYLETGR